MRSLIDLHSVHAVLREGTASVGQKTNRMEEIMDHHRLENVELKISLRTGKSDRSVIAEDLHGNHGHRFGLGGVHLARHDRGTRFILGKH